MISRSTVVGCERDCAREGVGAEKRHARSSKGIKASAGRGCRRHRRGGGVRWGFEKRRGMRDTSAVAFDPGLFGVTFV